MVPLRHIRDVNHLRPRMDTHKLAKDGRIRIIVNPLNQLADINLIAHMSHTAQKFMRDSFLNKQEWAEYSTTNFGFQRPPINKNDHLTMHLINTSEFLEGTNLEVFGILMTSPKELLARLTERVP